MASFFNYLQHNYLLRHDPSDVYATRVTSLKGLLTHLILECMNQGCFGLYLDKDIKTEKPHRMGAFFLWRIPELNR
jgi:hypothetical protein